MSLLSLSFVVSVLLHRTNTVFDILQVNKRDDSNGEEAVPDEWYECDCCGQVYRHCKSLRRHQRQAHTGKQTCPKCDEVLQEEEFLARHVMQEHRGHQPDGAMNGKLAAIPPPTTGDAIVDGIVSDNWHAIVSRHQIRTVQDIINIKGVTSNNA